MTDKDHNVIAVLLKSEKRVPIVADAIVGHYAVHLRIWNETAIGPGFAVTHRSSGISVWTVRSKEEALAVATHIEENNLFPTERDAMLEYWKGLRGEQQYALITLLSKVAPRYLPLG